MWPTAIFCKSPDGTNILNGTKYKNIINRMLDETMKRGNISWQLKLFGGK